MVNPQDTGPRGSADYERHLVELSKWLRIAILRILPIGIIVSLISWFLGTFAGLQELAWTIAESLLLLTFLIGAFYVSSRCLWKWFRRPAISEASVHHDVFKLVTGSALFVTFSALVIVFLALFVLGVDLNTIVEVAGAVVLLVTIAVLLICSRYAAVSFSADVAQLIREIRASGESLAKSYESVAGQLVRDLDANMNRVLDELEKQGERQASSIESLAGAVGELAEASREAAEATEEARRLQKEALRLQEKRSREAEERQKQREEARKQREEQERKRMKPRLSLRMFHTGVVFHHLRVQIHNGGMTGHNLRIVGFTDSLRRFSVSAEDIASQGYRTWDVGDVGDFSPRARFDLKVSVADARGRVYAARTHFSYSRETGFLGRTVGVRFDPRGFVPLKLGLQEGAA